MQKFTLPLWRGSTNTKFLTSPEGDLSDLLKSVSKSTPHLHLRAILSGVTVVLATAVIKWPPNEKRVMLVKWIRSKYTRGPLDPVGRCIIIP